MIEIIIKLTGGESIDPTGIINTIAKSGEEARERAKSLLKNAPFATSAELEYTINGIKQQFKINKPK